MVIRTRDDWWQSVDNHWADLLECASNVGANLGRPEPQYQELGDLVPFAAFLERRKQERDHETLYRFFNQVWNAAPDKSHIHSWPSWHVLCDLCSEYGVFEPEPDEHEALAKREAGEGHES